MFQGSGGASARAGRHAQYCAFGSTTFMLLGFDGRGLAGIWGWKPDHRKPGVHAATLKFQLVYLGSDCSVFKQKSTRFSILERTHWW